MAEKTPGHSDTPLDLDVHEGETKSKVWMRRILFGVVILLCVSFAAPTFGSCSGALGTGGQQLWGTFTAGGRPVAVHEDDFRRVSNRLVAALRMFNPEARVEDDDVWSHILLDAAAQAEGVHVPDEQVARFLSNHPAFQTAGKFDEDAYRVRIRELARYTGVDHEGFTAILKSILRTQLYRDLYEGAFSVPQSREAYEDWKKKNVKLTVDYVVQPFEPLREKARTLPVTDDDLRRVQVLPEVQRILTIPARRGLEAAYVRAREMTAAERTAAEEFLRSNSLLPKDETVETLSWTAFWGNRQSGGAYTRETWLAWQRTEHAKALVEWEKLPEPRPEKPKDPASEPWPEKPADQFYRHWYDLVAKEVVSKEVLRHMAARADRESRTFADLAAEYAKYGVRTTATEGLLSDADLAEKFPAGLGRDSELDQAVRTRFRAPEAGREFAPQVLADPVAAMRIADRPQDRGWIVVRWTAWEPARTKDVIEMRAEVEAFFRGYRANELAAETLQGIRAKVEAAGADLAARQAALRAAAREAGLDVRTIRRFNSRTDKPAPPVLAADAAPAQREAANRISWRNRVMEDYPLLSKQETGKLRDPNLLDDAFGAAFLVLLVEKHEPLPYEMDDATLRMERYVRGFQTMSSVRDALSAKELKRKFRLELTEEGRKATERPEPAPEK